jgi:ubiquinone/menaquinone biosynthesis C-methylase UbiE
VRLSCLDPSRRSIERLREKLGLGDAAQVGYADALPFADGGFDRVIMAEVLEHLDDDTLVAALGEVARVVCPTGKFIGTVPADEDLRSQVAICPDCGKRFHRWGHVQSFSDDRLRAVLRQRFDRVTVRRKAFDDPSRLNWKGRLWAVLRSAQAALDVRGTNQSFYFEAALPLEPKAG